MRARAGRRNDRQKQGGQEATMIILLVIGAVLFLLGSVGRAVGGRRHYW
ncbi:DUF6131 family protein [Streptomyces sp. NPDC048581]